MDVTSHPGYPNDVTEIISNLGKGKRTDSHFWVTLMMSRVMSHIQVLTDSDVTMGMGTFRTHENAAAGTVTSCRILWNEIKTQRTPW